tara:strand:- start:493 stop:663 length:171 start_codon:yes stop_codon:yes gene_type:complete
MIQIIAAIIGTIIMIILTIDLISQWKNSTKTSRGFADLGVQWFFWITIILLIVVSL